MLKRKKKILIAVVILAAACGSVPLCRMISEQRLLRKSEEEIYAEMQDVSSEKLIRIINRYEKKLPEMQDKTELLPFYIALKERSDEFSGDQLIGLIHKL